VQGNSRIFIKGHFARDGERLYVLNDGKAYSKLDTLQLIAKYGCENAVVVHTDSGMYLRGKNRSIPELFAADRHISEGSQRVAVPKQISLPSREMLMELSFESGFDKSLANLSVREVSVSDVVSLIRRFAEYMQSRVVLLNGLEYRIKSDESAVLKYNKYVLRGAKIGLVLNDLLVIRIHCKTYPTEFPPFFKVIDLRSGKERFDGYKAVHLYFQASNRHLPIEIQLWDKRDGTFNDYSHQVGYKVTPDNVLAAARLAYDAGRIKSLEDFQNTIQQRGKISV
jgi:putative GTP pyrophosphokinase